MSVRLYAVLRLRPRAGTSLPPGLQGERLRVVKSAGCAIAVADVRASMEPGVEILLEFDRVIRALSEISEAILPARFGAVSATLTALKSEIAERAGVFIAALDKVAGRVQMTVRLTPGSTGPAPQLSGPSPRLPRRPGLDRGTGQGARYLESRAAAASPPAVKALRAALGDLVYEEQVEAGAAGTSIYHLVERADVDAYLARARRFRPSGPFPPYAFVPGINHALWMEHDDKANEPATAGPPRSRTDRRSSGNTHR